MLKELLAKDFPGVLDTIVSQHNYEAMEDHLFTDTGLALYQLMRRLQPQDPYPLSKVGEIYHLRGELRTAGELYKELLALAPPTPVTDKERRCILKFAPLLKTHPDEFFGLLDVVAVHHPDKPLICYHLFWEDDFDFPDDYEPCDHEQVWVHYQPETENVEEISSFFHSRVISTEQAAVEANETGRVSIDVEWGKHGSLIFGWDTLIDHYTGLSIKDFLEETYEQLRKGGRVQDHPLKQDWPDRFEGSFADYLTFTQPVDTRIELEKDKKMIKGNWSNALLQQRFLRYNFHPKYDWPFSI